MVTKPPEQVAEAGGFPWDLGRLMPWGKGFGGLLGSLQSAPWVCPPGTHPPADTALGQSSKEPGEKVAGLTGPGVCTVVGAFFKKNSIKLK